VTYGVKSTDILLAGSDHAVHTYRLDYKNTASDETDSNEGTASETVGARRMSKKKSRKKSRKLSQRETEESKTSDSKTAINENERYVAVEGSANPFPELTSLSTNVVSLNVKYVPLGNNRLVAAGCQNGCIILSVCPFSPVALSKLFVTHTYVDGPITGVCLYSVERDIQGSSVPVLSTEPVDFFSAVPSPAASSKSPASASAPGGAKMPSNKLDPEKGQDVTDKVAPLEPSTSTTTTSMETSRGLPPTSDVGLISYLGDEDESERGMAAAVDLVVASAVGFALVFHNVTRSGFDEYAFLPGSDEVGSVTSIAVDDINTPGHFDILLATYNNGVLVYKSEAHSQSLALHPATAALSVSKSYYVDFIIPIPEPAMALEIASICGDSTLDLCVGGLFSTYIVKKSNGEGEKERPSIPPPPELVTMEDAFKHLQEELTNSSLQRPSS